MSEEEIDALKKLITLSKERKIVIKACDKGAGIIILNFKDHIEACCKHLEAKLFPKILRKNNTIAK